MTSRHAFAHDCNPAVAWTAKPSTLLVTLLFAPLLAFAQESTPARDTTAAPATAASMAGTSSAPAPAAQEPATTPRRPGETTTGRAPAPAVPAPASTPASAPPPTAALPGDSAAPAAATATPSTTTTAPATAQAQAAPALREAPQVSMPASTSPGAAGLLKTIMALLLVLGLLVGLAWLMKRYAPNVGGGSANLRVVGALNLGGRERIMVVEVGDQWIVVGAAPGRVNALHTMPRQEGELSASAAGGGVPATSFSDWLKKTIDKRNAT